MGISYNKLWKLLIDKKLKKKFLLEEAGLSRSTLTHMNHEEHVSTESLKIAENILTEQQIIDLAKKDVTVEYNQTSARFDTEKGLWTVSFSKKNTAGGDQVFTITHEGKIIDVEYGE